MVGYDFSFFLAHNAVFLLLAHQYLFHRFKQILLADIIPSFLHRIDRRFVDHIGKIRADRSAGRQSYRFQIHAFIHQHILGMYLKNLRTPFQIRFIHDDPAVKTARAQQRLIQYLRPVRSAQNQNSLGSIETIHFGQKLVQGLFSFLVSSPVFAVSASSDRIDLIDKYNTRRIFCSFLKQIPYPGGAHAHVHLDKIRTCQRKKRHVRLSCHRFCQQCLSCSRRSHQEGSFGQFCPDFCISARIMKKVNHFLQGFFRFILPCHVFKTYPCLLFHIHFRIALPNAHDSAAVLCHPPE